MVDARRMEVYTMVMNSNKEVLKKTSSEIIRQDIFDDFSKKKTWVFFGEGSVKCKEIIKGEHVKFIDDIMCPSASEMILLSHEYFKEKKFEDIAYFEPYYLKEFISKIMSHPIAKYNKIDINSYLPVKKIFFKVNRDRSFD